MVPFLPSVIVIGVSALLVGRLVDVNMVAMRFFRDVARSKARKRLYGNQHALIPMLFNMETPYTELKEERLLNQDDIMNMTREELEYFTGTDDPDEPLYLAIDGKIYDVSQGSNFYGPGGKYHLFVGKDATHAFATGCLEDTPECTLSMKELTEKETLEVQKWVELYDTHDKYKFVGYLIDDPIEAILQHDDEEEAERAAETQQEEAS